MPTAFSGGRGYGRWVAAGLRYAGLLRYTLTAGWQPTEPPPHRVTLAHPFMKQPSAEVSCLYSR